MGTMLGWDQLLSDFIIPEFTDKFNPKLSGRKYAAYFYAIGR